MNKLEDLMNVLRDKCPWDHAQTLSSLRQYTLEEVHELIEAVDTENWQALRLELGDLLFHIAFYARIADEAQQFNLSDVVDGVIQKMVQRHPHVFERETQPADDQAQQWDVLKDQEHPERSSLMDGVPPLPALAYAKKIQKRATRVGFDWPVVGDVLDKMREELNELETEVRRDHLDMARMEDEFGDVLFTLVNLARKLGLDAELALMRSNRKFAHRFRAMESIAQQKDVSIDTLDLASLESLYQQAKQTVQ